MLSLVVKKYFSHFYVVRQRVMLCDIVGQVIFSGRPEHNELSLSGAIFDPMESHVDCLGVLVLDLFVREAYSSLVVNLDPCRWLRVP